MRSAVALRQPGQVLADGLVFPEGVELPGELHRFQASFFRNDGAHHYPRPVVQEQMIVFMG